MKYEKKYLTTDRLNTAYIHTGKPGGEKLDAGTGLTRLVSTEATPISFTGVYLAMYAARRGSGYFAWFDYENLNR